MPYSSSLGAKRSFRKTFGSYPSCKVYMHLEKLDVDFQQMSKHAVADNPILRQTAVRNAGPDKNESRQKFILFEAEGGQ